MDEARILTDEFGKMGEEGDDVMLHLALDRVDLLDIEHGLVAPLADVFCGFLRNHANLGQCFAGMGFDLEPDAELRFGVPDGDHFRSRIARDHQAPRSFMADGKERAGCSIWGMALQPALKGTPGGKDGLVKSIIPALPCVKGKAPEGASGRRKWV